MTQLYVVFRPFKTQGKLFNAGDVVTAEELASLKYGKIFLNERKFKPVPTDEEELKDLQDYFQVRWGADFAANLAKRVSKGSGSAEPQKPGASAVPPTPGTASGTPAVNSTAAAPTSTLQTKPANMFPGRVTTSQRSG